MNTVSSTTHIYHKQYNQ